MSFVQNLKTEASRVGYPRAIKRSLYYPLNKYVCLRRLEVIYLTRDFLVPLEASRYVNITSRLATEADLTRMVAEGTWDLNDDLIEGFRQGDSCLLSFVRDKAGGEKLAGYTWVHSAGRPLIVKGLRLSIPSDYIYNFAGYTAPAFRGFGLQPYRHHELLNRPEWRDRKGMIGYVECMNWSSQKGQAKSGYQRLGSLTMIGTNEKFSVSLSPELKKLGIRRLPERANGASA